MTLVTLFSPPRPPASTSAPRVVHRIMDQPAPTGMSYVDKDGTVAARIIKCLMDADIEMDAGEIADELGIHVQTVRNSMPALTAGGSVTVRRTRRCNRYRIYKNTRAA